MSKIQEQAQAVEARIDKTIVGFDPVTIITILSQLLPILAQCFNRNDEPSPEQTSAAIRRYNQQHPQQLLKRTARRVRAESDEPMSKLASFEFARAIIAQACDESPEAVSACCQECL